MSASNRTPADYMIRRRAGGATVQIGCDDGWDLEVRGEQDKLKWIHVGRFPRDRISAEEALAIAQALTELANDPAGVVW